MDALYKAIVEALARRGQQERDRREEWERSLKPTQYLGNNLFQEMGGQPLQGRYLGKRSLIPGQFVPNIGRNPNKPVIPGLPNPVQETIEEVSPQQKQIFYNGIFTIDSPLDDTDFTELQMLNRVENRAPGDSTVTPWTNPRNYYSELHQTTFYYFNSKQNIQELFTHKNSQILFRGIAFIPAFAGGSQDPPEWETVYSVANPGNVICDYASLRNQNSYFTIYFTNSLNLNVNELHFRVVNENENTVGITDGFAFTSRYTKSGLKIAVAQGAITGGSSSNLQFQMLRGDNDNTLNIEVRIVKTFDGYMTTTEKGTTFAFYGCGNEDYPPYNKRFSKNGKNPSSLTSIDADPETNIPPAPNWDWRQGLVTGTAMINFPNLAYRFIQSHAFNLSSKRGFYCYKDVFLRDTDYPGLLSVITPMILDKFTVSEYDNSQGVIDIDYSQSGVLSFLSIKPLATDVNGTLFLKSINVEIQNIQDFCIPNKWNDNVQVRGIDHFPYIQVIQA